MSYKSNIVLIIGSAPDAVSACAWNKSIFSHVVAINNAWRVRDDWDFMVHPEDFPLENMPNSISDGQSIITAQDYVSIQNDFGGVVYAGGTMVFTTAYWALGRLRPKVMAFIGCDMIYPSAGKPTHFYGTGNADPLRKDVTLQSLEAKSARLLYMAHQQKCLCVNLSDSQESRLVFPRATIQELEAYSLRDIEGTLGNAGDMFDEIHIAHAINRERELGYYFESGRYCEHLDTISANECLALDDLWMKPFK
ncbi:MAG: hypothetical protein ACXW1T_12505 [Methylophilus sp.]